MNLRGNDRSKPEQRPEPRPEPRPAPRPAPRANPQRVKRISKCQKCKLYIIYELTFDQIVSLQWIRIV